MRKFSITGNFPAIVIVLLGSFLLFCTGCDKGDDSGMPPASVLDQTKTQVDSLYQQVSHSDAKDLIAYANLFFHALDKEEVTDSLIQYGSSAPVEVVEADVDYWMGEYLLAEERYHEALSAAQAALDLATEIGNDEIVNETHSLMSVIYFRLGMVDDAIANLKICFEADSRSGNMENMSSDLNNLAAMSLQVKQYENAREYIDRAIEIERSLDRPDVLAIRLGIASETYAMLDRLQQAESFAREAYRLDMEGGRDCKSAIRLSQLATVLIKEGKIDEAREALSEASPMLKECGNMYSYTVTECQLGDICMDENNLQEAAVHYKDALDIAKEDNTLYLQQRALKGLWLSLKGSDMNAAAYYIEQYASVTDSLFSDAATSDMVEMQNKFERQQLELEKERLIYEMNTRRLISYGIAFIVLLVILWLLYVIYSRNKTNRTIRNLEKIRTNFFTNITHEFRTPLTAILGLSKDIADKKFDSPAENERAVEIINRQSNELLKLVNQLLDISKVRSQIGDPDWRHGDIVSYVAMIVQNYRQLAVDRHIELVFSCAHTTIEMDFVPDYVGKIVRNLLSNALKSTAQGGHIFLELIMKGNTLVMRVTDDGVGIAKSELPNIFDPYYSGSGSQPDTSTGIGLSLVNEMVKAMHGSIKVVSQVGKGTAFAITLPISSDADSTVLLPDSEEVTDSDGVADKDAADDKRTSQKMALIVEDNNDLAFYIGAHLPKDYLIYYAQNGKEGLDKAIAIVPDIIITDIMMPEMDGIAMMEEIRKNPIVNHIPVIAITAKVNDDDRVEGLKAGFDAYLSKPFNSEELSVRVVKLLEQRELLRRKYAEPLRNGSTKIVEGVDDALLLGKLVDYIYSQLDKGKPVDIERCSDYMRYSSRQLSRKILAITGDTLNKYINRIRVEYAKRIMQENPSLSLMDISVRCGADSTEYFARQFRQYEGMTPTQYLKMLRTPSEPSVPK